MGQDRNLSQGTSTSTLVSVYVTASLECPAKSADRVVRFSSYIHYPATSTHPSHSHGHLFTNSNSDDDIAAAERALSLEDHECVACYAGFAGDFY